MARNRSENPVVLSRIYTRTGDDGSTALADGSRTAKTDTRLAAYADVEEANCAIGMAITFGSLAADIVQLLSRVQNELFDVGADLSVPLEVEGRLRTTQEMVDGLERLCDELNAPLPTLKSFVLPGGSEAAARLHVARTVARRAELASLAADVNPLARVYLNRLSDLLFIAARSANAAADVDEPLWKPGS